jgi:hypothetical protein
MWPCYVASPTSLGATAVSKNPELIGNVEELYFDDIAWVAPVPPGRVKIGLWRPATATTPKEVFVLDVSSKVARQLGGLLEMLAPGERLADSEPPMDSAQAADL